MKRALLLLSLFVVANAVVINQANAWDFQTIGASLDQTLPRIAEKIVTQGPLWVAAGTSALYAVGLFHQAVKEYARNPEYQDHYSEGHLNQFIKGSLVLAAAVFTGYAAYHFATIANSI